MVKGDPYYNEYLLKVPNCFFYIIILVNLSILGILKFIIVIVLNILNNKNTYSFRNLKGIGNQFIVSCKI